MDRHIKSWNCCVCDKDLKQTQAQCYNDRKYCPGKCIETIIEHDENMELYRVIEKRYEKREKMQEKINAKYIQNIIEPPKTPGPFNITKSTKSTKSPNSVNPDVIVPCASREAGDAMDAMDAGDAMDAMDAYGVDLFFC